MTLLISGNHISHTGSYTNSDPKVASNLWYFEVDKNT